VTATALLDADCASAPPTADASAMADYLLDAMEQPGPMTVYEPTSVRDVLRRLALDVAAARMAMSKKKFAQADDFVVDCPTASGRLG
jgi:hypothetical protein